jgi:hypothetical protein
MNIEQLKQVKTLVVHGPDCPDGRASALILHDALPDAEIVFVQYGTPLHKTLEPKPGVLFCDFTPYVDRVDGKMTHYGHAVAQRWVDAGTIVLDHHKGAADIVTAFGENGVFADEEKEPGVSGATLAFREVWSTVKGTVCQACRCSLPDERHTCSSIKNAREFATLAGVRDTWQKDDPRWAEACAQAAALMFWPWDKLLAAGVHVIKPMLAIGEVLLARDYERDTKTMREAYTFDATPPKAGPPLRVMCFEGTHTSDIADRAEVDLVVGWHYLVEGGEQKIVFSTRSRGHFSCLDLAKQYGGGGHKNAAGFKLSVKSNAAVSAQDYSPYEIVEKLVTQFLATR